MTVSAALNHLSTAITTAMQSQSTPNTTSSSVDTFTPLPQIAPAPSLPPPASLSQLPPVPITVPLMPPLPPFLGQMPKPISSMSQSSDQPLVNATTTGQISQSYSMLPSSNNVVDPFPVTSQNDVARGYQMTPASVSVPQPAITSGLANSQDVSRGSSSGFKPIDERLPIGIATAPPSFNLITRLRGQDNVNVNYIESQSGCEISVRGFDSGFREPITLRESLEPMYFYVSAKEQSGLEIAKGLLKSLIETTKQDLRDHLDQLASVQRAPPVPWNSYN